MSLSNVAYPLDTEDVLNGAAATTAALILDFRPAEHGRRKHDLPFPLRCAVCDTFARSLTHALQRKIEALLTGAHADAAVSPE